MIYSTPEFILFFVFVLLAYASLGSFKRARHSLLLAASLLFYSWAGVFDSLIFFSVLIFSWGSLWCANRWSSKSRFFILVGIFAMLIHLFFWKYAPWFAQGIQSVFPNFLGGRPLLLPLPVGISFFTLQGVAYLMDFQKKRAEMMPFKDFALFKSFFPQLVAGPIVRSHQLLPQIKSMPLPSLDDLVSGFELFSLGLFKKLVIADRMPVLIDPVFAHPEAYGRGAVICAAFGYTAQIYGDFSGYTDMGRGCARMLGYSLPENFISPYFAKSPSQFWKHWHITLSEWIRDYVYVPLGGGRGSRLKVFRVAIMTMLISGLWHGAAITFVIWGVYHGLLLVIERFLGLLKGRLLTFICVIYGWMIFRANSWDHLVRLHESLFASPGSKAISSPREIWLVFGLCLAVQAHIKFKWVVSSQYARGAWIALLFCAALFFRAIGYSKGFIYFNF